MAVTYPGGTYRPLGPQTQARMRAHEVICLHTMVGYLKSTDAYFRQQGYGGTESHFGVGGKWGPDVPGLDGVVWQWQDLDYTADANYEGNDRVISVETADNAPQSPNDIAAWTPRQLDAVVALVAWLCRRYGIPPVLVPNTRPGTRGIGYHAQGTAANLPQGAERWSSTVGKPCPTARRITQIHNVIIPRVQAALRGGPVEEDELSAEDVKAINDHTSGLARLILRGEIDGTVSPPHYRQSLAGVDDRVTALSNTTTQALSTVRGEVAALKDGMAQLAEAVGRLSPANSNNFTGDLQVSGTLHVEESQ